MHRNSRGLFLRRAERPIVGAAVVALSQPSESGRITARLAAESASQVSSPTTGRSR